MSNLVFVVVLAACIISYIIGFIAGKDEDDVEGLYYVFNINKDKPKYYHFNLKSAKSEAKRLAKNIQRMRYRF